MSDEVATGDGMAMAHRAQDAISNIEFVQFHPTALANEGLPITPTKTRENAFLITEAVRRGGGLLYNLGMERFMPLYDERAALASRDVVAISIDDQLKKRNEKYVLLDISHKPREKILSVPQHSFRVPKIWPRYNPSTNSSASHCSLHMWRSLCRATSLHGANRLASNSLLNALVFTRRSVQRSIDHMKSSKIDRSASDWWGRPVVPMSLGRDLLGKIVRITRQVRDPKFSALIDFPINSHNSIEQPHQIPPEQSEPSNPQLSDSLEPIEKRESRRRSCAPFVEDKPLLLLPAIEWVVQSRRHLLVHPQQGGAPNLTRQHVGPELRVGQEGVDDRELI
ncbi:unnamed protein product [Camellia sinensis]